MIDASFSSVLVLQTRYDIQQCLPALLHGPRKETSSSRCRCAEQPCLSNLLAEEHCSPEWKFFWFLLEPWRVASFERINRNGVQTRRELHGRPEEN